MYAGELGSGDIVHVTGADWPAQYVSGHLLFMRDGILYAQSFDPDSLALSGSPQPLAADVVAGLFAGNFAVSDTGTIAYRAGSVRQDRLLAWFDRSGKRLQVVGDPSGLVSNPSLSADGRQLAVQRTVSGNTDIWVIDLERNVSSRLTNHPGVEALPLWSPDGTMLAIGQTAIEGGPALLSLERPSERTSLGLGSAPGGAKILTDWSRDGRYILFKVASEANGGSDLWAMPQHGDRKPIAIANTPFDERDGQFSPDGRWVAFESDESGTPKIYVQPFPGPGRRIPVSTGGGSQVRWRADGRELFYVDPDDSLVAMAIDASGESVTIGQGSKLFATSLAPVRTISRQQYVVSRDGQRFLMVHTEPAPVPPVTLILNWRGVPTR